LVLDAKSFFVVMKPNIFFLVGLASKIAVPALAAPGQRTEALNFYNGKLETRFRRPPSDCALTRRGVVGKDDDLSGLRRRIEPRTSPVQDPEKAEDLRAQGNTSNQRRQPGPALDLDRERRNAQKRDSWRRRRAILLAFDPEKLERQKARQLVSNQRSRAAQRALVGQDTEAARHMRAQRAIRQKRYRTKKASQWQGQTQPLVTTAGSSTQQAARPAVQPHLLGHPDAEHEGPFAPQEHEGSLPVVQPTVTPQVGHSDDPATEQAAPRTIQKFTPFYIWHDIPGPPTGHHFLT
jgi:hypothetical protein